MVRVVDLVLLAGVAPLEGDGSQDAADQQVQLPETKKCEETLIIRVSAYISLFVVHAWYK